MNPKTLDIVWRSLEEKADAQRKKRPAPVPAMVFSGAHDIHTPRALCKEMLGAIELSNKSILVLYNIEFVLSLLYDFDVDSDSITFLSDHPTKSRYVSTMGVKSIITNLGASQMKFDVIVGNPPYQASEEFTNSKKLYIEISKIAMSLVKPDGYIAFVTPQAILVPSKLNPIVDDFSGKLAAVDFSANDHFSVSQDIISWLYHNTFKEDRKIKVKDQGIRYVDSIHMVSSDENRMLVQILNKVDFSLNGLPKLEIIQTQDKQYVPKDKLVSTKLDGYVEVVCSNTERIKYCHPDHAYNPGNQLVIPFVGNWDVGTEITNKPTNKELFVNKKELSLDQLISLKSYLDSALVKFCVTNYKKIKPSMGFVFLRKLPYIGYDKIWTDAELYVHFGLTQEEIDYIEANAK